MIEKNSAHIPNIQKLDFYTVEHEEIPYTLVHTKVIQSITNHFAGFIWVYLQSLPSNWKVNKSQLKKHFNIGEDKLKEHMSYLNKHKLIEYVRKRDEKGRLAELSIRVLNGTSFIIEQSTTGVNYHPVVHHTSGFSPQYINNNIYIYKNKIYTKLLSILTNRRVAKKKICFVCFMTDTQINKSLKWH